MLNADIVSRFVSREAGAAWERQRTKQEKQQKLNAIKDHARQVRWKHQHPHLQHSEEWYKHMYREADIQRMQPQPAVYYNNQVFDAEHWKLSGHKIIANNKKQNQKFLNKTRRFSKRYPSNFIRHRKSSLNTVLRAKSNLLTANNVRQVARNRLRSLRQLEAKQLHEQRKRFVSEHNARAAALRSRKGAH